MKQNGFFDSIEGDRKYTATQISEYLKGIVSNGVLPNSSTNLQVLAMNLTDSSSDEDKRSVRIRPGKAWIEGRWFVSDADEIITLDAADVLLSRIDRIVLRLDYTNRIIDFAVIKGEPSSTPVAPAITRTTEVIDLCLAEVLISQNQKVITQSKITDTRANTSLCGWVTSLIKEIDTETLLLQYEQMWKDYYEKTTGDFESWFADLQQSLSTVVMLRRYTNVTITTKENQLVVPIDIAQYDQAIDILEVYVNGILQDKDSSYISDATSITFINPLPVIGTKVTKVVYKNVNGEEATTVQEEVEAIQDSIAKLMKYNYFATGTNDNIAINKIIQDFYDGTGSFAGVDENASLELKVYGKLGVIEVSNGSIVSIFTADSTNKGNKRLILDFMSASKIEHTTDNSIIGVSLTNTIIKGLIMDIVSASTAAGYSGNYELEKCISDITGANANGFVGTGTLVDCKITTNATTGYSQSIVPQAGITKVVRGRYIAYRATGVTSDYCCAVLNTIANAYILMDGVDILTPTKTGFETLYAYRLQTGYYSIIGGIRGVANMISSEATGTITGEINISGS